MIVEVIKFAVAMGLAYMLARNMTSWWSESVCASDSLCGGTSVSATIRVRDAEGST